METFHVASEFNTAVYFERWCTGQFKQYCWQQTVNPLASFSFMDRPRFTVCSSDRTRLYETSTITIILSTIYFKRQYHMAFVMLFPVKHISEKCLKVNHTHSLKQKTLLSQNKLENLDVNMSCMLGKTLNK